MKNKYTKYQIESEIDKTLNSWDNVERIEANPYFFTRLQQRMENEKSESQRTTNWVGVLLRPTLLVVLLVVNVWTVSTILKSKPSSETTATITDFVEAYGLEYNPSNDYLNE